MYLLFNVSVTADHSWREYIAKLSYDDSPPVQTPVLSPDEDVTVLVQLFLMMPSKTEHCNGPITHRR